PGRRIDSDQAGCERPGPEHHPHRSQPCTKRRPDKRECSPAAGERGHVQRGPDRRTRAGSSGRSRFSATDKLCGARSKLLSNRRAWRCSKRCSKPCSNRRFSRVALRASHPDEDAFRGRRNRGHTRYSKVESAVRVLSRIFFVRVVFVRVIFVRVVGSCGFGKFETRAPTRTFRRSGACGTGRIGTGGIATEKLGTGQSSAGSTCSQI